MSNNPWDDEYKITRELVEKVISENIAELQLHDLKLLGSGWDNSVWLVNDKWCFRFPKSKKAAVLLLNEINVLSALPKLPVPTPAPQFVMTKPNGFPAPFYGHQLIKGDSADRASLTLNERAALATPIAQFLKTLHATCCTGLPTTIKDGTAERFNVELMYPRIEKGLNVLSKQIDSSDIFLHYFKESSGLPIPPARVLGHGDFYPRHILLNDQKKLCGVIDWGDCEILSPAVDLAIVYQFLPKASHPAFWSEYGAVSEEIQTLAKLRAIYSAATLAWYGSKIGDDYLIKEGAQGLILIKQNLR